MISFVIGGSGSGKSSYAESIAVSACERNRGKLYYLATMQVRDAEDVKKVDRHRMLRDGRGFITIEQPTAIQKSLENMQAGKKTALLECISNLTANEMFSGKTIKSEEQVAEKIMEGILLLKEELDDLVIVGSNVFEDGIVYEEATMHYIRAMGKINQAITAIADQVFEVVAGIPIVVKGEESQCV